MHKFEFTPDDLFINRLKTYAEYNVFIYQSRMSINRGVQPNGSGGLVVYDINANRSGTDKVYPFVESGSTKPIFKRQVYQPLLKNFSSDYNYIGQYWNQISGASLAAAYGDGTVFISGSGTPSYTSSYGSESPIKRNLTSRVSTISANYWNITSSTPITGQPIVLPNSTNLSASALQNVARKYTTLSDHFIFNSTPARSRDLVTGTAGDNINFITIPSMYYGSTIKKGSVELNYYITGSKIATCADTNHNGTLIGTTGSTSGSVVGLVLYDEGIIMLTSSNPIAPSDNNGIIYDGVSALTSSWLYYGTTLNDGTGSSNTLASASYDLNFKGTNYVNSLTMFAHAKKGHLNHSNNPTYRDLSVVKINTTGSGLTFVEGTTALANVVSASYVSASFEKTTYISKVNIYDEDGNLIAITSIAKPVKKTLTDEFTFKMKLDL
jgi:hypothetical protein